MARKDWFPGFMERNITLSIRSPEATSYARITAFNIHTVKIFFDKLEAVLHKYTFTGQRIFNLDETGVSTTPKVPKIVGPRGQHHLGLVTSRERGELVTVVGIINGCGNHLLPVFVFPRIRFDERKMMSGAKEGSLGLVHQSGWMTTENFPKVLEHLQKFAQATTETPILLIMDNHQSHISYQAIEFAKDNGIVILTLPPHTSNKLQPLDASVYGPFKSYFGKKVQGWMINNPGKLLSIYDLPQLVCDSWSLSATLINIMSGFRASGIWPYNRDIFTESDFPGSYVSDRAAAANPSTHPSTSVDQTNSAAVSTASNKAAAPFKGMRPHCVTAVVT